MHEISFLGHKISANGVAPEPDKIQSIQQWPQPTSFTTLRAYLKLTGYYRRFVPFYAKIDAPLTNILKLKTFEWSTSTQEAFQQIKSAMQDLIMLSLPDFESQFDVTTDASGMAIGAVLSQNNRPISFFSKKLCTAVQDQSKSTKEIGNLTNQNRPQGKQRNTHQMGENKPMEDATWESYTKKHKQFPFSPTLRTMYCFSGWGDVMSPMSQPTAANPVSYQRPKRITKSPTCFED
ncbi:unnamed protein product [Lactuca virosa]|uniref:Reverse transcriptase/retrotransposon-derived protein RNase H-like domain-containing protein n=1 Tax=Lactuca virosa TaxID=75947 RepID=A0AAU9MPY0_9ASTR|nr:unnamed protein product [Lactuca virosa]